MIYRMILKPWSLINVICNNTKTDPALVRRAIDTIFDGSNVLLCKKNSGGQILGVGKIFFGRRYGFTTYEIANIDQNFMVPIGTLLQCFFYVSGNDAFADLDWDKTKALIDYLK